MKKSNEEALAWYKRCPGPRASFQIGLLYLDMGEPAKAKDYFYAAIEKDESWYAHLPQEFRKWEASTVSTVLVKKPIEDYFAAQNKQLNRWRTVGVVAVCGVAVAFLLRGLYYSNK